jgi:hypothetical protein
MQETALAAEVKLFAHFTSAAEAEVPLTYLFCTPEGVLHPLSNAILKFRVSGNLNSVNHRTTTAPFA